VSGKEKKKGRAEEAAEKSGDVVGKRMKSFGVVKPFGKVAKETVTEKKEEKKE
jgi:hypothetical protein